MIKSHVQELESIKLEIRKLNMQRKKLREREKKLEDEIAEFLKSKDQSGLKYNGMAFVIEEKTFSNYKKQKDKDEQCVELLRSLKINSPEKVLTKLLEVRKGETVLKEKLKIKKIKN